MSFPPLPRSVQGLAGPIMVKRPLIVDPRCSNTVGEWDALTRSIAVRAMLRRDIGWQIAIHELCHSWLDDAGVHLTRAKEEAVCEAVGSGMMHVLRALA